MYIWQSSKWPQWKVDLGAVQGALSRARYAQGRAMGMATHIQLMDYGELQLKGWSEEAMATAQIEGEILQLNSVRASAARRLGLTGGKLVERDERTEATMNLLESVMVDSQQTLTHDHFFAWHAALFPTGRSGLQRIKTGAYRDHVEPMQIVTPRLGKPDVVHYQAPDSVEVPAHMDQLIVWFNQSSVGTDGLVRAALAHLWFEAIHPFEDGNGRLGRALVEIALAQDLHTKHRLWSLSQQIWLDRSAYYTELENATGQVQMDVTTWVQWFVGCIEKAAAAAYLSMQTAVKKTHFWSLVREHFPNLNASQSKAINKLYDVGPEGFKAGMSTQKYVHLCSVSRTTAYRELTAMRDMGLLDQVGEGRATGYKLRASLVSF
jgi:Fic family protein